MKKYTLIKCVLLLTAAFVWTNNNLNAQVLTLNIISTQSVNCHGGNDGSATVQAIGGIPPYTYLWSNGQAGPTATNLSAAVYQCTVTDLQNAMATVNVTIPQPILLGLSLISQQNITCSSSTGSATVSASGGTMPYSFSWAHGGSGTSVSDLPAGVTTVSVTDGNSCITSMGVNILQDISIPHVNIVPPLPITCTRTTVMIDGRMSDHGPEMQFNWTTSSGLILGGQGTLILEVGAPGMYTLEVTNTENGCIGTASINVSTSLLVPFIGYLQPDDLTCVNLTADIDASQSDTGQNFLLEWSTTDGHIVNGEDGPVVTVNKAGTYTLQILNTINGCSNSKSIIVVEDSTIPVINLSQHGEEITCDHPTATFSISSYNALFSWQDLDGNQLSDQDTFTTDQAGSYVVLATHNYQWVRCKGYD